MDKFPVLNLIRSFYVGLAGLTLLGSFLLAIEIAREGGATMGISFFLFAMFGASSFILLSESIGVFLRIEDHLDVLRQQVKSEISTDQSQPSSSKNTVSNQKIYSNAEQNIHEHQPIKDEQGGYSPDYLNRCRQAVQRDYEYERVVIVDADTYQIDVYDTPWRQSSYKTYTNVDELKVVAHTINDLWVLVEVPSKRNKPRGWLRVHQLNIDSSILEEFLEELEVIT